MKQATHHRAGVTVISMVALTLCAKALGMVRQMITASVFAASAEGIAFAAASRIPLAIFDMLFSTAIIGSFLPIYRGHLLSDGKRAKDFSSSFLTLILAVTAAAALMGVALARPILALAAPSLSAETMALAVTLLRIMFPSVIFAGAAYTLIGIMQSHERFLLPASVSAISNAVMIAYLILTPSFDNAKTAVIGLSVTYTLSWAAQFLTLAVPLIRTHDMPRLQCPRGERELVLAERRALPVMLGAWLIPAVTLTANALATRVDARSTIDASLAEDAAVVVLENAFSVFSIAGGLMTYGICNYLFPKLAARHASNDGDGFRRALGAGLLASLTVALPIALALFILADDAIRLLYLRGSFTAELADATALALRVLCLAMPAYGVIELLSRAAYSSERVMRPMVASLVGIATALIFALVLHLADAFTVTSVTLTISLALIVAAFLHLYLSRKLIGGPAFRAWLVPVSGTALSAAVMALLRAVLKKNVQIEGAFQNFMTIAIVFTLGFVVYLIWIFIFRKILFFEKPYGKEDCF
ncbi:MAG: hypothetical protein IJV98_01040 [Clostridia bacterium]|nr:hypothetical protein [Clostridia bacterium]